MTLRVLEHVSDADARLVAMILHKAGLNSLVLTCDDENAMDLMITGRALVLGQVPGTGDIELRFVSLDDLPDGVQPLN